ncbi:MAG TPA: DUF4382 domain-containing protein [Polyangiaceae bacterium]|nr:DUF4382 domain-containing protein [Polyangiaceae bacterium]
MTYPRLLYGLAATLGLIAGCNSNTTVRLELTDAAPDTSAIQHVYLTLDRVDVHVADSGDPSDETASESANADTATKTADTSEDGGTEENGWLTVKEHAGTFDLLALQNDVRTTLGELELPSGKITQIRLFIDGAGQNRIVLTNGQSCALDLSQVPPTGIKINHPFKALDVEGSSKLTIVVDFDLAESVDQIAACSFRLAPVIKIKSVEKS